MSQRYNLINQLWEIIVKSCNVISWILFFFFFLFVYYNWMLWWTLQTSHFFRGTTIRVGDKYFVCSASFGFTSCISVIQVILGHHISLNLLASDNQGKQQDHTVYMTSYEFLYSLVRLCLGFVTTCLCGSSTLGGGQAAFAPQALGFGGDDKSGKYGK